MSNRDLLCIQRSYVFLLRGWNVPSKHWSIKLLELREWDRVCRWIFELLEQRVSGRKLLVGDRLDGLRELRRGDLLLDHRRVVVIDMPKLRLGLLLDDGCEFLRGDAPRVGLPRLHDGGHRGGHVLVARGHALQLAHVLRDGPHLQRREPVRAAHELELGWVDII